MEVAYTEGAKARVVSLYVCVRMSMCVPMSMNENGVHRGGKGQSGEFVCVCI